MKRYTADYIGKNLGLSAHEVNIKLSEIGILYPNSTALTDYGKKYSENKYVEHDSKGRGGYFVNLFDKEVAYMIGDPDSYMKRMNKFRKENGVPPLTW